LEINWVKELGKERYGFLRKGGFRKDFWVWI